MRRFSTNRWWAFVLTLTVLLASGTALPTVLRADQTPISIDEGGSLGGGDAGDPDGPAGPNKKAPTPGRNTPSKSFLGSTAGDGGTGWGVWMWRLHVVLLSLKARFIR